MEIFYMVIAMLIAVSFLLSKIGDKGYFYVMYPKARKLYKKLKEYLCSYDMPTPLGSRYIDESFCRDILSSIYWLCCQSEHGFEYPLRFYLESDKNFLRMILAKSYSKLLYSPFALYSTLSYDANARYHVIFDYTAQKLIEIGHLSEKDYGVLQQQLQETRLFCEQLKKNNTFYHW